MTKNYILFSSVPDLITYQNIDTSKYKFLFVSPLIQKYSYKYHNDKNSFIKNIHIDKKVLLQEVKRKHSLITYYDDPNCEKVNLEIDLNYNNKLTINVKFTFGDTN